MQWLHPADPWLQSIQANDVRHHRPASSPQTGSEDVYSEDKSFKDFGQQARAKKDSRMRDKIRSILQALLVVGPGNLINPSRGPSDNCIAQKTLGDHHCPITQEVKEKAPVGR